MSLELRLTSKEDLSFVLELENQNGNAQFLTPQIIEAHEKYIADSDIRHLIVKADEKAIGYIILAGLDDENENIEFRRIVIAEKGKGHGRKALRLIKKMAFEELNAHRLWLDVKEFNDRAKHVYESEGFTVEGVFRECVKTKNGRESFIFMSMLKHEYQEN